MPEPSHPAEPERPGTSWRMLAIVSAGFIAMTVNWFNISTGFGEIADELHLTVPEVAFLISIFVAAYGVLHIPGGFLATRWGLRRTLAAGLALEAAGSLLSATAGSFWQLVLWRAVAGAGASVFAAVGIAAVSVWFRKRHHALALGISSAAFSAGTALGLYLWADITNATSWRTSVLVGGLLCLAASAISAVFFRVPRGIDSLSGVRLTSHAIKESLGNRHVWFFGIAFLGAYGAYLAASQLISAYGTGRGISSGEVGAAALLVGIAGVPGSILAGWLGDRFVSPRTLFVVGALLEAGFLAAVPLSSSGTFWLPALGIGFMFNFTFAVWQTVPGGTGTIAPENIGTAIGLMLSVSAVGGFVLPWAFGLIVDGAGYSSAWLFLAASSAIAVAACLFARTAPSVRRTAQSPHSESEGNEA
ncbi:nitrate/nitrite transporter [Amycolatopsis sp. NPDC052450]|uniref:nitrate/nitrite transporter n=1 Tax=Amycolatopsis sp. NPDC052450 TaxID=3363937 RepID=UPI0037C6BDE6